MQIVLCEGPLVLGQRNQMMAAKGPHDVAHTLNVASTIVSNYLQNALIKFVTLLSLSLSAL